MQFLSSLTANNILLLIKVYEILYLCFTSTLVQVDESFIPASQVEVMEVEHLLAEPRNDHILVDRVLYFHEENLGKCYDTENLSCGFELGLKTSIGNAQMT